MTNSTTDRNLLFGLIAMQTGLITRENLMTATGLWLQDKSQPMDELLRSLEFITEQQHGLLSELVNMHLDKHDGDAERSLAAVDAISSVRDELCELGDEDIEKTLGHVNQAREWAGGDATMLWTPPEPGQRFRILRPHAKGGLGIVNVAHDAELNREVALKEIQKQHADNPDSRSRFVQEAMITGGLEHPGIVPVYGLGAHNDNRPYYAMRLIRGDTLMDAINRFHNEKKGPHDVGSRRLKMRRLLGHFISLCNAIEYAHSRGILHRDIKPANVMLGKYGETLVVDWGLAKPIDRKEEYRGQEEQTLHPVTSGSSSATQMGSAVGTPSYMSPEQAAGRLNNLGTTADVYSLGATLYCLLTGQPSLADTDVQNAIRKAQSGDFPPPRLIKSDVPRALEAVCLKAMKLKPGDRYQSAAALSADVERLLADEPVVAYSESFGERLTRLARRHRAWVRAGAAALMLITVGSVVATVMVNDARQHESSAREKEEAARKTTEEQLRRSIQLRLASQAAAVQEEMPQRALLLASESIKSAIMSGDEPHQLAYEVLHATLADSSGKQVFRSKRTVFLPRAGQWLTTVEGPGTPWNFWRLDADAADLSQKITLGPQPEFSNLARSANGRWLAVGRVDGWIYLYDFAASDPAVSVRKWSAHEGPVSQSRFTSDGARLVSVSSDDKACRIWDLQQDRPETDATTVPQAFSSPKLAVSANGKRLAIADSGKDMLFVWDISPSVSPSLTHALKLTDVSDPYHNATFIAFGPDSRFLAATGRDDHIWLWDLETDNPEHPAKDLGSHRKGVTGLIFTPDGKTLISCSYDRTVHLFPLGTGDRAVVLRGHKSAIVSANLSPTGRFLATGSTDAIIRLWDLEKDHPNDYVRVLRGHDGGINSLSFSPEGDVLYSGSWDRTVRAWRLDDSLAQRRMINSFNNRRMGGGFANFVPHQSNGYLMFQLPSSQLRRWDIDSGNLEGETFEISKEHNLLDPMASDDGRWLLANMYQRVPTLIDLNSGPENPRIFDLDDHNGTAHGALIDPDSQYVITHGNDDRIVRWDLTSRDPSAMPKLIDQHPSKNSKMTVSLDGRWLFASSDDATIHRWDLDADNAAASEVVLEGHQKSVEDLNISPDGLLLVSVGRDRQERRTLRRWRLDSSIRRGEPIVEIANDIQLENLLFSHDSRYLVASEMVTGVIHVWDMKVEDVAASDRPLTGHSSQVYGISFSANDQFLASGELDGKILIWDMADDKPEKTPLRLIGHTDPVVGLRFFDDNHRLISISYDDTARVWELDPKRLLNLAREVAGRELSHDERKQYGLKPASDDGP